MSHHGSPPILCIVLAVVAAVMFAVSAVAQQRAAATVPEGDALLRSLIHNRRWWAGIIGDCGGYGFQVGALACGPVLVVQPILVSSLIFALPLAAYSSGRRISRSTWATAVALAIALACFMVVGDPTAGRTQAPLRHWFGPLLILMIVALAVTAAALQLGDPGRRALLLGTAGGILFGASAALTASVTASIGHGLTLVTGWPTYAMAVTGIAGLYLQQRAFQVGPVGASLPAIMITEPLAAAFVGITVLHERLHTGRVNLAVVVVSVVVMCVSAVVLSRAQADAIPVESSGAVPSRPDTTV